jgi:hypothetical protein
LNWSGQQQRINRDPVLSDVAMSVCVTHTDIDPSSKRPRTSDMLALPLDYLNGWLFEDEIRQNLIRYQRECYRISADAFMGQSETAVSAASAALHQVREMGLAIARMADELIAIEQRTAVTESRLDQAAAVVGDLGRRVKAVEQRVAPGHLISDEQAAEIAGRVKALAGLLAEHEPGKNYYQGVFSELYRRFGVSGYKHVPQAKFAAVLEFLEDWRKQIESEAT